jgi:hypothetical protein
MKSRCVPCCTVDTSKIEMLRNFIIPTAFLLHGVLGAVVGVDSGHYINTYVPSAIQSGPDKYGSTYAASASYSATDNAVMFTGTTWGRFFESPEQMRDEDFDQYGNVRVDPKIVSGCFMAAAALPGRDHKQQQYYGSSSQGRDGLFWTRRQRIKAPSSNEACNAIHYATETQHVLVAGHSEMKENTTFTEDVVLEETQQYGLVMDLSYNVDGDKSFHVVGGKQFKEESIIYPVALDAPLESEHDGFFVLYMEANRLPATHIDLTEGQQPHDPVSYFSYDAGFAMAIAKYKFNTEYPTKRSEVEIIEQEWFEVFKTVVGHSSKVFAGDVVALKSGIVIAAGATDGTGEAFGIGKTHSGMDGFVTKFDLRGVTQDNLDESAVGKHSKVIRIESQTKKDDFVTNLCYSQEDPEFVYAVGHSHGTLPNSGYKIVGAVSAFIMKIEVASFTIVWTRHLGGQKSKDVVKGMACAIGYDGIWLGGTAEDGVVLADVQDVPKAFGGKDIFFAKLSTSDGSPFFVKQMGTDQDDELVLRGGIVADSDGNAVIVGNTYGSFYRQRSLDEKESDVFILTVSSFDGSVASTVRVEKPSRTTALVFSSVIFLSALALVLVLAQRSYGSKKADASTTNRSKVTRYLSKFNIEDVDLRHSATGGWHCNFVGALAQGQVRSRPTSYHTAEETIVYADAEDDDEILDASGRALLRTTTRHSNDEDKDKDDSSHSSFGDLMNTYSESYEAKSRVKRENESLWGKEII